MCFPLCFPGKRETHKQFDPHPFPGQSRGVVYVYWFLFSPDFLIELLLAVLVSWSWVLLLPRLPALPRSLRLFALTKTKIRVVKTVLLANGHFARATPAIFVIFVDFRGPRSKIPFFLWAECNIKIFADFRQNHLFSAGDKTTVFQNDRFDNPDKKWLSCGSGLFTRVSIQREERKKSLEWLFCPDVCLGLPMYLVKALSRDKGKRADTQCTCLLKESVGRKGQIHCVSALLPLSSERAFTRHMGNP